MQSSGIRIYHDNHGHQVKMDSANATARLRVQQTSPAGDRETAAYRRRFLCGLVDEQYSLLLC